jgi:hypothetical protein
MKTAIDFLRRMYGTFEQEGTFVLTLIQKFEDDGTRRKNAVVHTVKMPMSEVPAYDWESIQRLNNEKWDVYFGAGIRSVEFMDKKGNSRGAAHDVIVSTALSFDVDFYCAGAHVSDELPKGLEDLETILSIGPDPSILIHSGHGVHAHWLYEEPKQLTNKTDRNKYSRFRKRAHAKYHKVQEDNGWTSEAVHDTTRIWRIPGFLNWKLPFEPAPITVLYGVDDEPERYPIELFGAIDPSPSKPSASKPKMPSTTPRKSMETDDVLGLRKRLQEYAEKSYTDAQNAAASADPEENERAEDYARNAYYIGNLLRGVSIEEKGRRDHALTIVCGIICYLTKDVSEFGPLELEFIVTEILAPSLQKWCDDNEDTDLEREMGKAIDKLQRIKAKDQEERSGAVDGMKKGLAGYKPNPLDEGSEQEPTDEALLKTAMVMYKGFYFIWDWEAEAYWPRPMNKEWEIREKIREKWPESSPLVHCIQNDDGQEVDLPMGHLRKNYATTAKDSYYTFLEPRTVYSHRSETLKVNPRPWRETEPEFIESIDDWLHLLGGESSYDLLCDWWAGCVKLDHPCAALYLHGPPGCGKTLFAIGATQLWSKAPSMYENAAGNFNEALMNSPILLVDEGFAESNIQNPTAVLRRLVATRTHTVNEKHGLKTRLDGYMRIIVAANNDSVLLSGKEERLSENDTRAMKERIAYVHINNDEAISFFNKHNKGNKLSKKWIGQGQFARHMLWLAQQRPLSDRGRFLVTGSESTMHDQMLFQGNERNEVLEGLVRFAEAPARVNARIPDNQPKPMEIGDGLLIVNTTLTKDRWTDFSPTKTVNKDSLPHSHLLRHLKSLSPLEAAIKIRVGEKTVNYWPIPIELIISYARSHDIGDVETIIHLAQQSTTTTSTIANHKKYRLQ